MATVKESPIQTKSALGPQQPRQIILPKISQVDLLWGHYKAARGTLERLAAEGADAHSAYADRALRLLEVLVLRKEKVGWGFCCCSWDAADVLVWLRAHLMPKTKHSTPPPPSPPPLFSLKGAKHFLNMTLGCPVIANNPRFDPQGDGKRRGELPPTVCVRVRPSADRLPGSILHLPLKTSKTHC